MITYLDKTIEWPHSIPRCLRVSRHSGDKICHMSAFGCALQTEQPYYCGVGAPDTSAGGGESRSSKYLKFGHSMTETFECDLRSLLGQEAFFYDPYIVDEVKNEWSVYRKEETGCTGKNSA